MKHFTALKRVFWIYSIITCQETLALILETCFKPDKHLSSTWSNHSYRFVINCTESTKGSIIVTCSIENFNVVMTAVSWGRKCGCHRIYLKKIKHQWDYLSFWDGYKPVTIPINFVRAGVARWSEPSIITFKKACTMRHSSIMSKKSSRITLFVWFKLNRHCVTSRSYGIFSWQSCGTKVTNFCVVAT